MKPHQYAEALWLIRRLKMNNILTIVTVCALSAGSMAFSLHAEQGFISRLADTLTVALANATR